MSYCLVKVLERPALAREIYLTGARKSNRTFIIVPKVVAEPELVDLSL